MKIDYWYKNGRENPAVYADCYFYPNEGIYRGNVYDANGNMVGDYTAKDSVEIEKRFPGIFGQTED